MMRMKMSAAAAGLLRALLNRAGIDRDRILLTMFRSTDWQSLTFIGEQHEIGIRIPGPDAAVIAARLADGIEDDELMVPGHVVADIRIATGPVRHPDESMSLELEALTVEE